MINNSNNPADHRLPLLALRGLVLFPGMTLHFDVGRKKSILARNAAMGDLQEIFLVAQRDVRIDDPTPQDLYEIGVIGNYGSNPRFSFKGDTDLSPTMPMTIHYPLIRFFKASLPKRRKR